MCAVWSFLFYFARKINKRKVKRREIDDKADDEGEDLIIITGEHT